MKKLFLSATLFLFLLPSQGFAYPDFIGYGYASCMTCHWNGLGGGPLNDYGRALWSAEIASRWIYPKSVSDEKLGEQSGFLGSAQLPYWIRPHVKYRGINVRRNPGSSEQDTSRFYQMQADVGFAAQFDEVGKYVAVLTWGNMPTPEEYGAGQKGVKRMLTREAYLRAEVGDGWFLYAGQIEKAFGIRNVDHTSYQRTFQGFNNRINSVDGMAQSLGLIVHRITDESEWALNGFGGSILDESEVKQKGFSGTGEVTIAENKRLGASLLTQKSDIQKKDLFAVHYRQALSKGSGLLFEYGIIQDEASGLNKKIGSYNLLQGLVLLSRGYFLKTTVERHNREFKPEEPDRWKFSGGLLMFPIPRLEIRTEFVNGREFSNQRATDDVWALQGQVHVSL